MTCTPEEIERKRKIALAKLEAKKLRLSSPNRSANLENGNCLQQTPLKTNIKNPQSTFVLSPNTNNGFKPNLATSTNSDKFYGYKVVTGSCSLISDSRFEVKFDGFNAKVIDVFKTIPSRLFNPQTKLWSFNLEQHELLHQKLKQLQPEVNIGKLPTYVLKLCKASKENYELDETRIEPELLGMLMPFQKEGVRFGVNHHGRCLIADDMGLGKTLQALAIASYYRDDWPVLIISTSSMRNVWENAIHNFLPSVPLACIRYMMTGKDIISDATILIVSYDLMSRCVDKLAERQFGVLIVDESHIIKNFKAKCTKSAHLLSKSVRRVILLTGTPALSRPSELYSQLSLIDDSFFGGFFEFSKRYCDGKTTPFGWDSSGKSNLTELEIVLSKRFMIRRTKNEVLSEMPNKLREIVKLDVGLSKLSQSERFCLDELVQDYIHKNKGSEKHSALLSLFSESARIKAPAVCVYIDQVLQECTKFLVFAHHYVMLNSICDVLKKHNKKFMRIDGSTTSEQRKYFIDKFQLDDSYVAAVLSITAANTGITLTAAKLVIFAELHWNPSILLQAESRAHRIGQENEVVVRYLIAPQTVDDHIWPLLNSKQDMLNEVGLSKDSFKDLAISDQIVSTPSHMTRTVLGTKRINEFMIKSNKVASDTDKNSEEVWCDGDDELFANVDVDL